eukprot:s17_g19.t1
MSLCSDLDIDRLCIRFHAAIPYQQTLPLRFLCATGLWVARHALRICFPWKCFHADEFSKCAAWILG